MRNDRLAPGPPGSNRDPVPARRDGPPRSRGEALRRSGCPRSNVLAIATPGSSGLSRHLMRPAVHRLPLPLVLGEMAGPAGVDCGDLCPLCPRLATLTASRPRRRRVLASRGVKDSSVMRMGMSGRRVVLADGLIPTDCVAYLGLRQLVFLTKDAKTRVAVLGEVGDLGGEDSATADGWGAADAIGVDLNVADVLARHPAVDQLVGHDRLGDVLEAVGEVNGSRPRSADIPMPSPLADCLP